MRCNIGAFGLAQLAELFVELVDGGVGLGGSVKPLPVFGAQKIGDRLREGVERLRLAGGAVAHSPRAAGVVQLPALSSPCALFLLSSRSCPSSLPREASAWAVPSCHCLNSVASRSVMAPGKTARAFRSPFTIWRAISSVRPLIPSRATSVLS